MSDNNKNVFKSNSRYFTISVYVLAVVMLSACFIKAIVSWNTTRTLIGGMLSAISPFLIGLFLAFILNPFVKKIDQELFTRLLHIKNIRIKKILSILLAYTVLLGFVILFFIFLIPQMVRSLTDLIVAIQDSAPKLVHYIDTFEARYPDMDFETINKLILDSIPSLTTLLQDWVGKLASGVFSAGRSIISWVLNILISLMVSCYMILDKKQLYIGLKKMVYALLPTKKAASLAKNLRECSSIFTGFVVGKTIDSLIIGILCFILMTVLDLEYSLIISLIVGVTNMIPYFGPFIGAVPGVLILIMVSPKQMLIFLILIIVLQQFDGLYLGPKILGNSTGLRPLWIIFAITFGGWAAGAVGMFLGVPTVAVIAFLLNKVVNRKLAKKGLHISADN